MTSVGPLGITAETRTVTEGSGQPIVVARFPAATTAVHLHVGSSDPPGALSLAPSDASNAVSGTSDEASLLVAAFNGGFKANAAAGGVEIDGRVVSTLLNGAASAVIDSDGTVHLGIWGHSFPAPGEQVIAVRQNLQLLVEGGAPTAAAANEPIWGAVLGPNPIVARSALGTDAAGDVYFAGSMGTLPIDLANALVSAGATTGMQLDINPFWVTLGIASTPGGTLVGQVPGATHDPSIYLQGWERDFFTVLARPRPGCQLVFPTAAGVAAADPPSIRCGPVHKGLVAP